MAELNYVVVCEECGGDVAFPETDNRFESRAAAFRYAGWHDGREHPETAEQRAVPQQR